MGTVTSVTTSGRTPLYIASGTCKGICSRRDLGEVLKRAVALLPPGGAARRPPSRFTASFPLRYDRRTCGRRFFFSSVSHPDVQRNKEPPEAFHVAGDPTRVSVVERRDLSRKEVGEIVPEVHAEDARLVPAEVRADADKGRGRVARVPPPDSLEEIHLRYLELPVNRADIRIGHHIDHRRTRPHIHIGTEGLDDILPEKPVLDGQGQRHDQEPVHAEQRVWGRLTTPRLVLVVGLAIATAIYSLALSPIVGDGYDDAHYVALAKALAQGQGFSDVLIPGAPPEMQYPPGFPLVLSLVWLVNPSFPANAIGFKAVSVFFTIGLGVLVYRWLQQKGEGDARHARPRIESVTHRALLKRKA